MRGLRDSSISRAAVGWGIPVQTDRKQIIYVWFDGLRCVPFTLVSFLEYFFYLSLQ